ncbi:T3SS effector HopA1 family protein [Streptomyces sp. NPDC001652]|uniref:T3SS effector HopA1 family protein n=1 Tax=Streptomyces sp. NPDC001652 TaxID=3154393 RepID=UPI00332FA724
MTTTEVTLCERLRPVLDDVVLAPDGLSAELAGERIGGETPREFLGAFSDLLYERVHAGLPANDGPRPKTLRHPRTEAALTAVVPHTTSPRTVEVVADESDRLVVRLDGVRVSVAAPERADLVTEAGDGRATLRLPAARPALSQGFFLVDGSLGHPASGPLLRLYAHITAVEHVTGVWRAALEFLEDFGVPYRAKVLSCPQLFPRRDALVVYLGPEAWHAVSGLVAALAPLPGLGAATSPFTRELAPGVSLAWEPDDRRPGAAGLSFGQHRAQAVAEGLLAHRTATGSLRAAGIAEALLAAGADPSDPFRNTASPPLGLVDREGH